MAADDDSLEQYYPDGSSRRIERSLFCEQCGYNLRTLPYAGRCTECGNSYNARGLNMKGILIPQAARFPSSDLILFFVAGGVTVYMFFWFRSASDNLSLALTGAFAALTLGQFWLFYRDAAKYFHCRRLVRQIRAQRES